MARRSPGAVPAAPSPSSDAKDALEHELPAITREYKRLTGLDAELFEGTSPGADRVRRLPLHLRPDGLDSIHMLIRARRSSRSPDWARACSRPRMPARRSSSPSSVRMASPGRWFTIQVDDLIAAGIERICIIVQPGEEQQVVDYLRGPGAAYRKHLEKYPELSAEAERMQAALDRICFAVQETPGRVRPCRLPEQGVRGRRSGAAVPGGSPLPRRRPVLSPPAHRGLRAVRRQVAVGCEPHRDGRSERLRHDRRKTACRGVRN